MSSSLLASTADERPSVSRRMAIFDVARGFSVVSMVLFHLCYDLRYLYGCDLAFFRPPFQDIWRASISWTFLFVAGCMCSFSRDGLKRSLRYLSVALIVFIATTLVAVDTPISFGIIFCMGASTLIDYLLATYAKPFEGKRLAILCFVLFLLTLGVPRGYIGFGTTHVALPRMLYATPFFSALGFPGPHFASGDYYPIIPFTLMFLTGACMGRQWKRSGYPSWAYEIHCAPLEAIGKAALPVYVIHQPLILGLLELLF